MIIPLKYLGIIINSELSPMIADNWSFENEIFNIWDTTEFARK